MIIKDLHIIVAEFMLRNFKDVEMKAVRTLPNVVDLEIKCNDYLIRKNGRTTFIELKDSGNFISLSYNDYTRIEVL